MALAGTRPMTRSDELLRSPKELREHRFVVDDIARRLAPFGNVEIGALGIMTLQWVFVGYSLAFDGEGALIGGLGNAFMSGVDFAPREGSTIPELVFFAFQATFCIITVALVSGAVVERMRFGPFLLVRTDSGAVGWVPDTHAD